jgi:fatty acid desaturase
MDTGPTDHASSARRRLAALDHRIGPGWRHALGMGVHAALIALCVWVWIIGWWWACLPLWCVLAWLNHAALTRLHEAAHGMLFRTRWLNEAAGMLIGTLSLTTLSVYRYVHNQHHAHLGRERDPEFWPYNLPGSSRARRLLYAWSELVFGWVLTPALYSIRTARAWRTIPPRQRRRLALEWALMLGVWALVLAVVAVGRWWALLVVGHVAPAWLAGTMQTIRKFTEHLGRHGDTILAMTRTVVYERPLGRAASRSQLHVDHHGTHHRWARIPYHTLPAATRIVYGAEGAVPVFPSHWSAMRDMLPHLLDPKLGPQWLDAGGAPRGTGGRAPV